jgi:hypothetical protein
MEIRSCSRCNGVSHAPCDTRESFILQFSISTVSSCLESPHVRVWCIQEQKVYASSNITSHRNRLLLFVKHLVMRTLTRKYRVRLITKFQDTGSEETIKADPYSSLPTQLSSLLEEIGRDYLFQHGGTTAPTEHITTALLLEFSDDRISGFGLRVSRSTALTTLE